MTQKKKKIRDFFRTVPGKLLIAVCFAGVLIMIGITVFSGAGIKKIKQDTYAISPENVPYTPVYHTSGTVVPKDPVRLLVPGMIKTWTVRVGERVEKDTGVCVYNEEEKDITYKSSLSGIVTEIEGNEIVIAKSNQFSVRFYVPGEVSKMMAAGMSVRVGKADSKLTFLSSIAGGSEDLFEAEADVPAGNGSIGQIVDVEIKNGEEMTVWKVPQECVVSAKGKTYVFYPSWLDHVTDLKETDYREIRPVHYEEGYYFTEPAGSSAVLKLSDLAESYLEELLSRV